MEHNNSPWYYVLFVALFALVLLGFLHFSPIHSYVHSVKDESVAVDQQQIPQRQLSPQQQTLADRVEQIAGELDRQPVDAVIDSVWKAIPGYNGLRVNREKTIFLVSQLGVLSRNTLMIEQVEPAVQLDDLPPSPIYRGNLHKPMVSLMVNVAWGTEYLPTMLDIFDRYHVKVTFFLDGQWIERNEDMARSIVQAGHEVGNHAYSHPDLRKMGLDQIREEMVKTQRLIERIGGHSVFFAPPSGAYDERVVEMADRLGMKTVLWTLDTVDWREPPPEVILERILPGLENGALILMHPTDPTTEALPRLIEGIMEKELLIGKVSELISSTRPSVTQLGLCC